MIAAIKLENEVGLNNYEIYEMNDDIGGTWLQNRYPGAACDIPIHVYSLSFERKPDFQSFIASQEEILEYMQQVSKKYDLPEKIFFQHQIQSITWNQETHQWNVAIKDLLTRKEFMKLFDVVITATGSLRIPKIPDEFQAFKGPIIHTAMWNDSVDLNGKVVAVVGTGASAIQAIPEVRKIAKKLLVYQRQPSWILPKLDFFFPSAIIWLFKKCPLILTTLSWVLFLIFETLWNGMTLDSKTNKFCEWACTKFIRNQLKGNATLIDKVTPKVPFGCQRIGFANNYYPTYNSPNVSLITSKIQQIKNHSIITDEGEEAIEVLILATGFKITDYFAPLQISDKNGDDLLFKWKKETPSLFLGVASHNLPNFFVLYGPNTSTGHNSVVWTVEIQVDWVIKCLREMHRKNAKGVSIKKSAEERYMTEIRSQLKKMVWSVGSCSSWYLDEHRNNVGTYPGNLQSYRKRVDDFDVDELDFVI